MVAIKGGVRNLNVTGFFLAGQKTLRQRRTLIGKRIFCRDDCQLPFFAALGDELLGRVSGSHASAQDDDSKGLHVFGLESAFYGTLAF